MGFIRDVAILATGSALFALGTSAHGAIIGVQWKNAGPNQWELYAELEPGFRLTNADLGDEILNAAPAGENYGLFVSDGTIVNSSLIIGSMSGFQARSPSITPVGTGVLLDAAWFIFGGEFGQTVENTTGGTILGVKVLSTEVSPGAILGGVGPDGTTPSRIFLFANDGTSTGTIFGVFDIPAVPGPGAGALAICGSVLLSRRRRHT